MPTARKSVKKVTPMSTVEQPAVCVACATVPGDPVTVICLLSAIICVLSVLLIFSVAVGSSWHVLPTPSATSTSNS